MPREAHSFIGLGKPLVVDNECMDLSCQADMSACGEPGDIIVDAFGERKVLSSPSADRGEPTEPAYFPPGPRGLLKRRLCESKARADEVQVWRHSGKAATLWKAGVEADSWSQPAAPAFWALAVASSRETVAKRGMAFGAGLGLSASGGARGVRWDFSSM
jgi:hypothetical protein